MLQIFSTLIMIRNLTWAPNKHIRMISKLSFDSMLEFQLCYHKQLFILKCTKIEKNSYFKLYFWSNKCSIGDFFKKRIMTSLLTCYWNSDIHCCLLIRNWSVPYQLKKIIGRSGLSPSTTSITMARSQERYDWNICALRTVTNVLSWESPATEITLTVHTK